MSFTAALRDLNKLNTFVRVAQRRSFTHAAAELRTRPSVVSKRMKELEQTLGFRLINRSTHGLVLTDAGEGLFQHCLQMLAKLDDYVVERPPGVRLLKGDSIDRCTGKTTWRCSTEHCE